MSNTLKYENDNESHQSFHLYEKAFDKESVYLELAGFQFDTFTSVDLPGNGIPRLTVKLPVAWAEKLGLTKAQVERS